MQLSATLPKSSLPWWTWVVPLLIFHAGTEISLWSKVTTGSSLFYFPAPMAVILIYWWGPRILPAYYLNATLSAGLWDLQRIVLWPVYGAPEVVFALLSWLFFIRLAKGKCWLPDIRQTIFFLLLGVLLPLTIYKFILEGVFVYLGDVPSDQFWRLLSTTSFGDFISCFGLTVPALYFFSGPMARKKLATVPDNILDRLSALRKRIATPGRLAEVIFIASLLFVVSQTLLFTDYWFIYGSVALYAAMRWGMGAVVIVNTFTLLLTYLIPSILDAHFTSSMILDSEMLKIQLGSSILYVFSTITGRVISDVGIAELKLNAKNKELEQTNKELDRFVYSVSHDLSAPLKSIQGLVSISLLDQHNDHKQEYLSKIGDSASKLDFFIKEILDYSRNKRLDIHREQIQLQVLCDEIVDDLKYMDRFQRMNFDFREIKSTTIYTDRLRLKMILNNLFSNAIKFQKRMATEDPLLKISVRQEAGRQEIVVRDNGQGIRADLQTKIFDMFFRANEYSNGSGLGLYIAQEAAEKIGGRLYVESAYGKGSDFILELPKLQG